MLARSSIGEILGSSYKSRDRVRVEISIPAPRRSGSQGWFCRQIFGFEDDLELSLLNFDSVETSITTDKFNGGSMSTLALALFVAVPVVLLTTAFMYFMRRGRAEDPKAKDSESNDSKLLWGVTIALAVVFAGVGFPKVGSTEMVLTSFGNWGYPDSFHYMVGGVEFIGAILLLIPVTASAAALVLCGVMVGAAATHALHGPMWMIAVNALLFGGLAWVAYQRAGELFGRKDGDGEQEREAAVA